MLDNDRRLKKLLASGRLRLKYWLGNKPRLYLPLVSFKKESALLKVNTETDIVIEGYPRSANSFAVEAFRFAQKHPVKIAHHLHVPAQILWARHLNIPTLVLIRNPVTTVISQKALLIQANQKQKNNSLSRYPVSFKDLLSAYITFYSSIKKHRERYIVGEFGQVTEDFGLVIQRLNRKFGTEFDVFIHTKENVNKVMSQLGHHAGPTLARERIKEQLRGQFKKLARQEIKAAVNKATKIYAEFVRAEKQNSTNK